MIIYTPPDKLTRHLKNPKQRMPSTVLSYQSDTIWGVENQRVSRSTIWDGARGHDDLNALWNAPTHGAKLSDGNENKTKKNMERCKENMLKRARGLGEKGKPVPRAYRGALLCVGNRCNQSRKHTIVSSMASSCSHFNSARHTLCEI